MTISQPLRRPTRAIALLAALGAIAAPAGAQSSQSPVDLSGVIFGNYQFRTDSAAQAAAGGHPNQFSVDRVYLTVKAPVGDRASIRATTDIVQAANGWTVRLKYGYLQFDALRDIGGNKGFNALARIGMLHNVVIDHEETFWPRYLGSVALEKFGFFSSSDLGLAAQVTLPGQAGEVYSTVTNGPGYASAETDRYKDVALRLSLTPLARTTGPLKTFTISPWIYRGLTASRFVGGGAGQVGAVDDAMARNRWGILAGVKDPRLTLAVQYGRRTEDTETGANTTASPRVVGSNTGTLWSVHGVARPLSWRWGANTSRLGLVGRFDRFTPTGAADGWMRQLVGGIQYEPTARTALALDYQELGPQGFAAGTGGTRSSSWFLHWSATF